jgi:hypothetical protein
MCAVLRDIHFFEKGGMDTDSAIEYRERNDFGGAWNLRTTGTEQLGAGYLENIESNVRLSASLPAGINRCIGSAGFEQMGFGLGFIWNSQGQHQILEIDYGTQVVTPISASVLNLNPQFYVDDIDIINQTFLVFNDAYNPPGYINYPRLKAGGYGSLTANDFYLIKEQPPVPISASFGNDQSRSVNLLQGKGWQFRAEGVGLDFEYTPFGTISQIKWPASESTPEVGTNVTQNNNLVLAVNIWTNRLSQLILAATYGGLSDNWVTIQTINYSDMLLLPVAIDISNQIYQAYDPVTQTYYFVFYNDGLYLPIAATQTDQLCDTVPLVADSQATLNGNELIYGGITIGYPRPSLGALVTATNYNPNLSVPVNSYVPLSVIVINPGHSGSGEGNHKRLVTLEFNGQVQQNDRVFINFVDIRNASNVQQYSFQPATFGEQNNTPLYVQDNIGFIPYSSYYTPGDGNSAGVNIITSPYYTLQSAYVVLFNAGSGVFKSIGALKLNSSYQIAFAGYDTWGRPLPIDTGFNYVVKTNSYAQAHGQTPQINWSLPTGAAFPAATASMQVLISPNNTHQRTLYTIASIISYQGEWNAFTNSPPLSGGAGLFTVGIAYQVGLSGVQNLGYGPVSYPSGSYIIFNGTAWDNQPKADGDIANPTSYYFYLNSLAQFNAKNNTSVLTYSFTQGDRCTLSYSQMPGVGNPVLWYDGATAPLIDVQVQAYNQGTYILKVNQTPNLTPSTLQGLDVLIEIWTPKAISSTDATGATVLNETVFYETGLYYPVTNGVPSQTQGIVNFADVYFQIVGLGSSQNPNLLYNVLVENFNFSPYYPSAYPNWGRPRSYNDTLQTTEQVANLVYSEIYIYGSMVNGLTRFFPANIYGNQGGQTSSNFGRVRKMQQINLELLVIQELNHGTVPVYTNLVEDQSGNELLAVSQVILGNFRYTQGLHIGMGNAKDSFAFYQNIAYWIDPHRSEPVRWAGNGAEVISGKMSKFFKQTLQAAYASGLKVIGWYDVFNNEYLISIQQPGGQVVNFPFTPAQWQFLAQYSVLPNQISITSGPFHSSASYNNITGIVTLIAPSGYVGSDTLGFTFPQGTKNACFGWTAGTQNVNPFAFIAVTNQPLSTQVQSNFISVIGNTLPAPISIVGGQYSINGGAFTSAAGTTNPGDTVQVQVLTSGSNSMAASCTLTIDGQSATFTATTLASGTNAFNAQAAYGMNIYSINNATAASVPPALNNINLLSPNQVFFPYVAIGPAGGQIEVQLTGTPAIPGHIFLGLNVNGVQESNASVPTNGFYPLTFTTSPSSPTPIVVYIYQD